MDHKKQFTKEEIEKRKDRLEEARDIRSHETDKNDQILSKHIYRYPGKTSREIEYDFSTEPELKDVFVRSYLINALKRLENDGLITFKTEEKQGKIIKKYFYKHLNDKQNKIVITKTELEKIFNEKVNDWSKIAQIVALNDHTIIITTEKNNKILNESIYHEKPLIKLDQEQLEIIFPKKINDFYKLDTMNYIFKWSISSSSIKLELKNIPENLQTKTKKIKDILVLEDDDDQREILTEDLEEEGYNVISCKSEKDILNGIKKWRNVDYFVADDDIGGNKIARAVFFMLQKKFPNLRAGLISGASRNEREEQGLLDVGFTCIFQKGKPKKRQNGLSQICDELIEHLGGLSYG